MRALGRDVIGRMRKRWSSFVVLGGVLLGSAGGASEVGAQHQPDQSRQARKRSAPPSGTNLRAVSGSESASTLLSFNCSYVMEGPKLEADKALCRVSMTGISRPSAEQLAERLRQLEAAEDQESVRGEFAALCQEAAADSRAAVSAQGPHQTYREMLRQACASGDLALGKDALRFEAREIWAHTCEARNHGVREYEFDRVDGSTWRAMNAAAVGGTAMIQTIWKRKGVPEFAAWSFKQVTSGDPTCAPAPFRECTRDANEEWTSEAPLTVTGCAYFK